MGNRIRIFVIGGFMFRLILIALAVAVLGLLGTTQTEAARTPLPTPECVYNPCVITIGNHFGEYGALNGQGTDYQRAVEFVINDWSKSGVFLKFVPSTVPNKSQVSNESTNPCQGGMITVCVCPGNQGLYNGVKFTACVGCPVGGSCDVTSATTKYNLCWTIGKTLGIDRPLGQPTCMGSGAYSHPNIEDVDAVAALHADRGPGCIAGSSVICSALTVQDADEDNDGVENWAEVSCGDGALWYDAGKVPERTSLAGDQNGNGLNSESFYQSYAPGNLTDLWDSSRIGQFDCDGDGHEGAVESHIGTTDQDRCGQGSTNVNAWPPDFVSDTIFLSTDSVDIADINSYLAPRRLDTDPGDPNYDVRWDLEPGPGLFVYTINIADLTRMLSQPRAYPPMFNYAWSMNGPTCTN